MDSALESNYAENAHAYNQFISLPLGALEQQLFDLCITKCAGMKVLDLGGGTGCRARDALKAGADTIDVVDISREMMQIGKRHEESIGRDRILWQYGDVSKPLDDLQLGPYDLVVANGIFDHAHTEEELEAMWRNTAVYLKPGGRLITNRNNPLSMSAGQGKYGVVFSNHRDILGGLSFQYRMLTNPPIDFQSIALDKYYKGSLDIPKKFFDDFQTVPWQETPIVKADPEFWEDYLADPILYIYTARRLQ